MHRALSLFCLSLLLAGGAASAPAPNPATFNTVKQKLAQGRQVVGGTVDTPDVDIYCAMAGAGFDFLWIEMQHSPLTYAQVGAMIRTCPGPAIPFIRVPTDSEGDIQKAVDIGALGVIVPLVDSVQKIRNAVTFAKYPAVGKRSLGGGQYGALWGARLPQVRQRQHHDRSDDRESRGRAHRGPDRSRRPGGRSVRGQHGPGQLYGPATG